MGLPVSRIARRFKVTAAAIASRQKSRAMCTAADPSANTIGGGPRSRNRCSSPSTIASGVGPS